MHADTKYEKQNIEYELYLKWTQGKAFMKCI